MRNETKRARSTAKFTMHEEMTKRERTEEEREKIVVVA